MTSGSRVVLVSGLQGAGKTTLGGAVAQRLGTCLISRDPLMQTLLVRNIPLEGLPQKEIPNVPELGFALQTAILTQQLGLGSAVVLECVMSPIVQKWIALCREHGAIVVTVECICSDRRIHRDRIERRHRAGLSQITWEMVEPAPPSYRSIPDADYVADAVEPVSSRVAAIMAHLDARA